MLQARLAQGHLLRKLFEGIKDLVSDINLECHERGISMQSMDSSHVALVSFHLADTAFESYRCDVDRTLGLNIASICKVFKACGATDSLIIRCEDEGDAVQFILENDKSEKMSHLELKLLQIDQEALTVPESEFDSVVVMPSKELMTYAKFHHEFSDSVTISVDKNELRFISKGDIGGGSTVFKPTESDNKEEQVSITCKSPAKLQFALRYINSFAKAATLSPSVKLSMTDQNPLELRYFLSDVDESMGYLRFFLAPKIEEVDESMG